MAEEFARAVEDGLRLSRRVYLGKDRAVAPPRPMSAMEKATHSYLPTAPMLYAVIENPAIVDNPDIPSYQPHVHGRCDPPALIPLQMNSSSLDADCYLDTAFLTFTGSWRVHCVKGSKFCDCRIAIPMGEQGSIQSVEVEVPRGLYRTQLVPIDDRTESEKAAQVEDGSYLKSHIFTVKIPQIDGGTNLLVTISWSQKLSYHDGEFSLKIPFSFPEYVTPAAKKFSKREKIKLNVNCGLGTQVLCRTTSHPLKELRRQAGRLGYLYEADVINWSSNDFVFTYLISSSQTFGGVLLQSPSALDTDQREMFCCYLFPGIEQRKMVFRKELVFVIDISGSMRGQPLEDTKSALFAALSKLDSQDAFSIIAFNDQTYLFSSSLELATKEAIENATQWVNMNFVAGGGTNVLNPLNQALEMFSNTTSKAIPLIFLITDGATEDERHICDVLKSHQTKNRTMSPRICTFGIGRFCNHYFLRMLAMLGRGFYDAAYDVDSIEARMENLFATASSIILANICIDFETLNLEDFEVYPYQIPDLSSGSPLVLSGRYCGVFPKNLEARGILADLSNFSVDLKVQETKDIPLDKVLAKHQIDILTAQAWLTENKKLEEKIAKMSVQNAVVSEYTRMTIIGTGRTKGTIDSTKTKKVHDPQNLEEPKQQKIIVLQNLGLGFGNLTATAENTRPGSVESKPDAAELFVKAASSCCSMLCEKLCCMCCIQTCSKMNDQCSILMTQLLGSLACLGCFSCCELCCSGDEG